MRLSHIIKIFFLLLFFFVYVFNIHFAFLPFSTNLVVGVFVASIYALLFFTGKHKFISKQLIVIFILYLIVILISAISLYTNSTFDLYFIKDSINEIFTLFTACFLVQIVKKVHGQISFKLITQYYVVIAIIQAFISLFFFFFPDIQSAAFGLLSNSELTEDKIDALLSLRLIGFGVQFFRAGIIYSFVLMLIAAVIKNNRLSAKETYLYIIGVIIIFALGMMTARTTLVGFLLAILILLYTRKHQTKNKNLFGRIIFTLVFLGIIAFIVILNLSEDTKEGLITIGNFGFEMFVNYFSYGEATSSSVEAMKTMYVFPDNIKTWIIGDGYFSDPHNSEFGYYMSTDIGYSRLLFYFGIVGTIAYIIVNVAIIYYAAKVNEKRYHFFFLAALILFLGLNMKGLSSISFLIYPFLFVNEEKRTYE